MDNKHEHSYKPSLSKVVNTDEGIMTIVLLHCTCGEFSHSRIPGTWTWEEITRKPGKEKTDANFLQEMGISTKVRKAR